MDKLKALGRGTQIMTVAAVLLLIDSFLKWETVDLGPLGDHGWSAWHGFLGVVMGILTIVLIARVAARLAAVDVPIPLSFATTSFVLGLLIAICGVLRFLTVDLDRTIWAWIGAALAIVVAVGAWLEVQEAGGIESLFTALAIKNQISPPTINIFNQDPECDLDYCANAAREMKIDYAVKNNFGFGGTNGTLVFKRV